MVAEREKVWSFIMAHLHRQEHCSLLRPSMAEENHSYWRGKAGGRKLERDLWSQVSSLILAERQRIEARQEDLAISSPQEGYFE